MKMAGEIRKILYCQYNNFQDISLIHKKTASFATTIVKSSSMMVVVWYAFYYYFCQIARMHQKYLYWIQVFLDMKEIPARK